MVALLQCGCTKSGPHILPVDLSGHLGCHLQVAAFDGEIESGLRILDKVEGNLGVSLLLQVPDNALTDEIAAADDLKHLVVVLSDKGKFESVLGRVDGDGPRLGGSVQAVDNLPLDSGEVDGLLERLDDTIVTCRQPCPELAMLDSPVWQRVFDVVEGGVDENTTVVPRGRLDPDRLVDKGTLGERLVRNGDRCTSAISQCFRLTVFAQERDVSTIVAPHDVFHWRGRELGKSLLLLNVKQDDRRRRREQERGGTTVKDLVGLDRALDGFREVVGQVTDLNVLSVSRRLCS
jgi:hypothetical protein